MPQRRLFIKILMIAGLLIAFAVGLNFVKVIVYERQSYHSQVIGDIAHHQISTQTVINPFISVPFTFIQACDAEKNPQLKGQNCTFTSDALFFPEQAKWNSTFKVSDQEYQRTIYHAISYIAQLQHQGHFKHSANTSYQYQWDKAKFILPIKDLRGVKTKPVLTIADKKYSLDFPKNKTTQTDFNYLEVNIPEFNQQDFEYAVNFELEGLKDFSLIPIVEDLSFDAKGNWGDLKFKGDSLPQQNNATLNNFHAAWSNITLGYQNQQTLINCWAREDCQSSFNFDSSDRMDEGYRINDSSEGFAVEFIEPINIYSQTDRAIKYGWMITLITFGCFFLFEMLKGLRIHPVQYGLVGTAQSIFFILLLSLSEQISFITAYSIAAIACISLMSWYLSFVLKNWRSTALFSVLITSLYGVMYMLLQSAEKTFLLGSLFAFAIVAAVMYLTRHIDWYQLSINTPATTGDENDHA